MLAASKYIPGLGKKFKIQGVELDDDTIGAAHVAPGPAIDALVPGAQVEYVFNIPDAATANYDFVLAHKTRVTNVIAVSNGAQGVNANTVQVAKGTIATPISDAISLNGKVANDVVRGLVINMANWEVDAGGVLRIVSTKVAGVAASRVIVQGTLV